MTHVTTVPLSLVFLSGQPAFMRARGIELRVVSSPGPQLDAFGVEEQVPVFAVPMARQITPLADLVSLVRLVAHFRSTGPDIVHGHTPKGGLLAMSAAAIAGVPHRIYHMRGLPLMGATGWRRLLLTATERVSCALADEVICVSHSIKKVAVELRLAKPSKLEVLLGGSGQGVDATGRFDPSGVRSARGSLGLDSQALVFGFVGRLVRDKGVEELAQAWKRVVARYPEARLVVVGPFEARDPVSASTVQALNSDPTVLMVGATTDTPPLYAAMDVVVLPTYREGFPNVPLEAASMGLPVVATRVAGCVDAVEDGVTGTLVRVHSATALADAMLAYAADASLREQHGRAGRARVLKLFQREAILGAIAERYRLLEARVERSLEPYA